MNKYVLQILNGIKKQLEKGDVKYALSILNRLISVGVSEEPRELWLLKCGMSEKTTPLAFKSYLTRHTEQILKRWEYFPDLTRLRTSSSDLPMRLGIRVPSDPVVQELLSSGATLAWADKEEPYYQNTTLTRSTYLGSWVSPEKLVYDLYHYEEACEDGVERVGMGAICDERLRQMESMLATEEQWELRDEFYRPPALQEAWERWKAETQWEAARAAVEG